MSALHITFQFYFTDDDAHGAHLDLFGCNPRPEQVIERLKLDAVLDAESEYLETATLHADHLELSFTNSTSMSLNHALVRRLGECGSDFCRIHWYNDQVDESGLLYLYRGKTPAADDLVSLKERFGIGLDQVPDSWFESDTRALEMALDQGLDPNEWIDGHSLLEHASWEGNPDAFELLLERGADPDTVDDDDRPLLHVLTDDIDDVDTRLLQALIRHGANTERLDENGASFLWLLGRADRELRQQLIANGARLVRPEGAYHDKENSWQVDLETALHHVDVERAREIVAPRLLDDSLHDELAELCCRNDGAEHLDALLKLGFAPRSSRLVELTETAAHHGAAGAVERLLDQIENRGIALGAAAQELVESLASPRQASSQIARITSTYSGSVSTRAIREAVAADAHESLEILLAARDTGPPDEQDDEDESLFHQLLDHMSPSSLSTVLRHGFDPFEQDWQSRSVVERVFADAGDGSGDTDQSPVRQPAAMQDVLTDWINDRGSNDALRFLLMTGDASRLAKLLDSDAVRDPDRNALLLRAAAQGHADVVDILLRRSANVEAEGSDGNTPLVLAIAGGHTDCCRVLLDFGASVDAVVTRAVDDDEDELDAGAEALLGAMGLDKDELHEADADIRDCCRLETGITEASSSCLMLAANLGHVDIVGRLLTRGADIDEQDDVGFSSLMYAATAGHPGVVTRLLESGADTALCDDKGNSALHYAAVHENPEVSARLLDAGADIDSKNSAGRHTPLSLACLTNAVGDDTRVIELLIERGADLDARSERKFTPLTIAARHARMPVLRLLLDAGADTNVLSTHALTPYDYYQWHAQPPIGFDLQQLEPSDPNIGQRKQRARIRRRAFQVTTVLAVSLPIAWLSPTVAIVMGGLASAYWGIAHLGHRVDRANIAALGTRPEDVMRDNPMLGTVLKMTDIMQEVELERERKREVIRSWQDDEHDRAA